MPKKITKVEIRKIVVSLDEQTQTKLEKKEGRVVESFYPIDRHDCACNPIKKEIINKLTSLDPKGQRAEKIKLGKVACPAGDKLKKYEVYCKQCDSLIAKVKASSKLLKDFCDLHYICQHDNQHWFGCMTVNISPYSGKLGFECTCGQDTRDFSEKDPEKEKINSVGREFGTMKSKFKVVEAK